MGDVLAAKLTELLYFQLGLLNFLVSCGHVVAMVALATCQGDIVPHNS